MTEQAPTVGRVVHYYGRDLLWHFNMELNEKHVGAVLPRFAGPFLATVVSAQDGRINLRVDYPSALFGSERVSEIRENVGRGMDPPCPTEPGNWVWPPRG